jgi:FtsZ-interacting cell division protein ZipA
MTTATILVIAVAVVVVAILAWYLLRQERSKKLRSKFGPEYTHAIQQYGNQTKAENALLERQKRHEKLHIRSLSDQEREDFADKWHITQSGFVDDPARSIRDADTLVNELMGARGYPMREFEDRAEDLSVDHPQVVRNYRAAHAIAVQYEQGKASTEDLRQGLVHYRDLFDELLEAHIAGPKGAKR